jgi:hypothetical protein
MSLLALSIFDKKAENPTNSINGSGAKTSKYM